MDSDKRRNALCSELDKFCIPAALIEQSTHRLLLANDSFRETMDPNGSLDWETLSRDRISIEPAADSGETEGQMGCRCTCRVTKSALSRQGQSFPDADGLLLVLLASWEESQGRDEYETGRVIGRQMERQRVRQLFHRSISPDILAAAFAAEALVHQAGKADARRAEQVQTLSHRLAELLAKLQSALEAPLPT
jgi:uncharacterized protein YmfQ (DUF2313 family)